MHRTQVQLIGQDLPSFHLDVNYLSIIKLGEKWHSLPYVWPWFMEPLGEFIISVAEIVPSELPNPADNQSTDSLDCLRGYRKRF